MFYLYKNSTLLKMFDLPWPLLFNILFSIHPGMYPSRKERIEYGKVLLIFLKKLIPAYEQNLVNFICNKLIQSKIPELICINYLQLIKLYLYIYINKYIYLQNIKISFLINL